MIDNRFEDGLGRIRPVGPIRVHQDNIPEIGDVTKDDPDAADVYNRIVSLEKTLRQSWKEHTDYVKNLFKFINDDIDLLRSEVEMMTVKYHDLREGSSVVIIKDRKIGVVQSVGISTVKVKIDNEEKVVKKRREEVQKIG